MKYVTVRQLQVNLTTLLRELPFKVTRYGKVIAIVQEPQPKKSEEIEKPDFDYVKEMAGTPRELKDIKMCKHGAKVGLCKHGCKK